MQAVDRVIYRQSIVYRYGLALLIALAFLLASKGLHQLIRYNPVVVALTAIIIVSWIFGRGPGLVSALILVVGIRVLFLPPQARFRFDFGDATRLLLFVLLSGFVSYLVGARRRAESALLAANADLERRVQERTAELRALNEDLRRSNQALRRANADLEQFAYSASHDLQEPLRNVSIYGQILGRRYNSILDERGREFLKIVTDGAQRMEMLVSDLLTYTQTGRSENGDIPIIDANAVLDKTLSSLSAAVAEAGAQIVNEDLPRLRMHETHLQQLFQNVIGNALKYRAEEPPRIRVSAKQVDHHWHFSIQDNGIGIRPEYKERIFGLFKRLHHDGKYAGTGIGLAICQRLVERYDGRIWVESESGKGATFFFTIRNGGGPGSGG